MLTLDREWHREINKGTHTEPYGDKEREKGRVKREREEEWRERVREMLQRERESLRDINTV